MHIPHSSVITTPATRHNMIKMILNLSAYFHLTFLCTTLFSLPSIHLTLRLDVCIEASELELALGSTKCRCLGGLDIGIRIRSQCRSGIRNTCVPLPSIQSREPLYWAELQMSAVAALHLPPPWPPPLPHWPAAKDGVRRRLESGADEGEAHDGGSLVRRRTGLGGGASPARRRTELVRHGRRPSSSSLGQSPIRG